MAETGIHGNSTSRNIAIVLAGGRGNRMNSDTPKQYMEVCGKPILYYSLKAFEESFVDEIILVVGEGDVEYCKTDIVNKYNFKKISSIVTGGKERFHSVYNGINAIHVVKNADDQSNRELSKDLNNVFEKILNEYSNKDSNENSSVIEPSGLHIFIHDGARPCVTQEILRRCLDAVDLTGACVAAMPVKDTIKIVDEQGYAISTPDRNKLWQIQTPQVFLYEIIKTAYDKLFDSGMTEGITDDAMVVEKCGNAKVKMVEGSYDNIKVTTPNDIEILNRYFE